MTLATPSVDFPNGAPTFSTNRQTIRLTGTAAGADTLEINGSSDGVEFDELTGAWSVQLNLVQGVNTFLIQSKLTRIGEIGDEIANGDPIDSATFISDASPIVLPAGIDPATFVMTLQSSPGVPLIEGSGNDYNLSGGNDDPLTVTRDAASTSLVAGVNNVFVAYTQVDESATVTFEVILVNTRELAFRILPPVGVQASNFSDKVKVKWVRPQDARIDGFNVYASSNPQGTGAGYTLLNSEIVTDPVDIESDIEQLQELVSTVRQLDPFTGEKLIDEDFTNLSKWQLFPLTGGAFLGTDSFNNPVLNFTATGGNGDYVIYKLNFDFGFGTRTRVIFERLGTSPSSKVGIFLGELPTSAGSPSAFDPTDFVGVEWYGDTGTAVAYWGDNSFSNSSAAGAYSVTQLIVDIVVTRDNKVEYYLNEDLFFTTSTSISSASIASNPVSLAGRSEMRVQEVSHSVGEFASTIETRTITNQIRNIEFYEYDILATDFSQLNNGPIYIVVTSVGFDPNIEEESESTFSQEVFGELLPDIRTFFNHPERTQREIRLDYLADLSERDPTLDLKPGSVVSDIHIGPPSVELERAFILLDFVSRSQAFVSLLDIDYNEVRQLDVSESDYKQRLRDAFEMTDIEVQTMIDQAYDRLAANFNVFRKSSEPAVGEITFFSNTQPTTDLTAEAGTIIFPDETTQFGSNTSVSFRTVARATIPAISADSFFNPLTARWEVTVGIEAVTLGSIGNISANRLTVQSGSDFDGVVNYEPTSFGQDEEDNKTLSERASLAFVSVDVGTAAGYQRVISEEATVRKSSVIPAGDPLMYRDWDPFVQRHIGGKVDIYVRGESLVTTTDTVAVNYPQITTQNVSVSDPGNFTFKVTDSNVVSTAPIFEIVSAVNVTRGQPYFLDNITFDDFQTFTLDPTATGEGFPPPTNASIGLAVDDVIQVIYRQRTFQDIVPTNKPVEDVTRVTLRNPSTGVVQILPRGILENWEFFKTDDPLLEGGSVEDNSFLRIYFANGVPSGDLVTVSFEPVTLAAELPVALSSLGIRTSSIVVTDDIVPTTTYVLGTDYSVRFDETTFVTTVSRIEGGAIAADQDVFVTYQANEQLEVEYVYDNVVQRLQEKIAEGPNQQRHVTADVLVKKAVPVAVFLDLTVVLKASANFQEADRKIRTVVSRYVTQLGLGAALYQSDIIAEIEGVPEVDFIVVPFSIMTRDNGSIVHRECITNFQAEQFMLGNVQAYLLKSASVTEENPTADPSVLQFPPRNAGGFDFEFHTVYVDNYAYQMTTTAAEVAENHGRAFVQTDGTIVISPHRGIENLLLSDTEVEVSYAVDDDTRVLNITVEENEFIEIGTFVLSLQRTARTPRNCR